MKKEINITFLGAAETVTGSKYLVRTSEKTILVDCGLFQGLKRLRDLNRLPLPVSGTEIDLVILTHAHLDHCGYLPCLVKNKFSGKIYGTKPTIEIAKIILEDSAKIQEEDAERANRLGFSKHQPARPLYDMDDVEKTLPHFMVQPLNEWIKLSENISFRYRYNSHILGATFVELKVFGKTLVFSGDIGRSEDPLLFTPQKPDQADVLFIESTYGDRNHSPDAEQRLMDMINDAAYLKGTILIPGFAVERIQLLMYLIWQLRRSGKISEIPVYMDSPMGAGVLELFHHNLKWHKLSVADCNKMSSDIQVIKTPGQHLELMRNREAKIIIAGSGMASGGRILPYFQKYLGDENATILLSGYQAEGTRGRMMEEGARYVKIYGEEYEVKARVKSITGLSAHADQKDLISWMSNIQNKPERIFITHGEKEATIAFRQKIKEVYHWDSEIPQLNQTISLNG